MIEHHPMASTKYGFFLSVQLALKGLHIAIMVTIYIGSAWGFAIIPPYIFNSQFQNLSCSKYQTVISNILTFHRILFLRLYPKNKKINHLLPWLTNQRNSCVSCCPSNRTAYCKSHFSIGSVV